MKMSTLETVLTTAMLKACLWLCDHDVLKLHIHITSQVFLNDQYWNVLAHVSKKAWKLSL